MKGIQFKTRQEWIHQVIGADGHLNALKMDRVIRIKKLDGWHTAMSAAGPALEPVAFVHDSNPLSAIVKAYNEGQRWFEISETEQIVGGRLWAPIGVIRLAQAGFALLTCNSTKGNVELRAAAPNEALYVNKARAGGGMGGNTRRVVDAFLHITMAARPQFNLTIRRRLKASEIMKTKWGIRCKDLLSRRGRIRFTSNWLLPGVPAGPPVRFKAQRVICLGRRTFPDGTQKCGVWEEQELGM